MENNKSYDFRVISSSDDPTEVYSSEKKRNVEVIEADNLLDENGFLKNPGWSRSLVQHYNRNHIKVNPLRIKEWDYYLVYNEDYAFCVTVSDLAYSGMVSITIIDFNNKREFTETQIFPFPLGKLNMPSTSKKGDVVYGDKNNSIHFINENGKRRLVCYMANFRKNKHLKCDITLYEPEMDSMVIATPFKKDKKSFYYNQKINCMPASGTVILGNKTITFHEDDTYGTLDWGRGVWTYDNVWYWGSGSKMINGKPFGFNIGYGFGDTKSATENVIFYDNKAHKIDDVTVYYSDEDYMQPWYVTSSDGRFEMKMEPIINRSANINLGIILSDQNQVFGKISGTAILDNGDALSINNMICFIERVRNKY